MAKYVDTVWELRTYDVWGNEEDGYEVNDSYNAGTVELTLQVETYNAGTPYEFEDASPSEAQIKEVLGIGDAEIDIDGDDLYIYVDLASDGYPVGEMHCVSHESLSPILERKEQYD